MSDKRSPASPSVDEDEEVAAPPPMPVQSTLYITPDGRVHFGALFHELVPVAQALDPTGSGGPTES